MEQMSELLRELALKLGTTTEYLWGVLIRQALIDGIMGLAYMLITIVAGVILFYYHLKFSKKDDLGRNRYWFSDGIELTMFVAVVLWGIMFITSIFVFSYSLTALINPEYWALKRILDLL